MVPSDSLPQFWTLAWLPDSAQPPASLYQQPVPSSLLVFRSLSTVQFNSVPVPFFLQLLHRLGCELETQLLPPLLGIVVVVVFLCSYLVVLRAHSWLCAKGMCYGDGWETMCGFICRIQVSYVQAILVLSVTFLAGLTHISQFSRVEIPHEMNFLVPQDE